MGNREALLDAAAGCIAEQGYAHTTARDLVSASSTNLGAIGYHFGSKERLLNEALYRAFARWLEEVAAQLPLDDAAAPWEVLAAGIERFLEGLDSHRDLCLAFVEALAQAERSPELRTQMAAGYERYRHAIADHLRAFTTDLPEAEALRLAGLVVGLCDGLLIQWLLDPDAMPGAAELAESLRTATGCSGRRGERSSRERGGQQ